MVQLSHPYITTGKTVFCLCYVASVVSDSATPWTVAHQALVSMGFSREEYWSGLPCPPLGDLPNPGIEPKSLMSPVLASGFFTSSATREAPFFVCFICSFILILFTPVIITLYNFYSFLGFLGSSNGKESTCNVGDLGLIPGSGRFPGEGHGNPLQYSCLENSMDRGA